MDTVNLEQLHEGLDLITLKSTTDELSVGGRVVDAKNWPDQNLIVINRLRWNNLSSDGRQRLVVHEVVSVAGHDDRDYQLSDAIVTVAKTSLARNERVIRPMATLDCLDVPASSLMDGARTIQWSCKGTPNQRWIFEPLGNGLYKIVSVNSGKCLDVDQVSKDEGVPLIQHTCHGRENQQFELIPVNGLMYKIRAVHSQKCVSIKDYSLNEGTQVVQYRCKDDLSVSHQLWAIENP